MDCFALHSQVPDTYCPDATFLDDPLFNLHTGALEQHLDKTFPGVSQSLGRKERHLYEFSVMYEKIKQR